LIPTNRIVNKLQCKIIIGNILLRMVTEWLNSSTYSPIYNQLFMPCMTTEYPESKAKSEGNTQNYKTGAWKVQWNIPQLFLTEILLVQIYLISFLDLYGIMSKHWDSTTLTCYTEMYIWEGFSPMQNTPTSKGWLHFY
jgi:hypothetical protein